MKQKTIQMPASDKKQQANGKVTIIDPNWLYILKEAERNDKYIINH